MGAPVIAYREDGARLRSPSKQGGTTKRGLRPWQGAGAVLVLSLEFKVTKYLALNFQLLTLNLNDSCANL